MDTSINELTVRVYGIFIDSEKGLLVSDELIKGQKITKFPGGGLELGEGAKDCLQREFKEELNLDITVENHIYTTDYFQKSWFKSGQQFFGIYYKVASTQAIQIQSHEIPFDFSEEELIKGKSDHECFRWIAIAQLTEDTVSLPTDKIVVKQLIDQWSKTTKSTIV